MKRHCMSINFFIHNISLVYDRSYDKDLINTKIHLSIKTLINKTNALFTI